mgnify:CR=1 FL=1
MNHSVYRIFLDIYDAASQVSLCAKKGDSNRRISAGFTENGKPYNISDDCTAIFRAKKPDGTVLYNTCLIDGNIISFDLTTQTTAEAGAVNCEITLYGQDKRQITSPRFDLIVDDTVYDDSEIESSDEFTALAEAMAQFGGANSAAEAAEKSAKAAASSEQAAASSAATATEKAKSAASSATAAANSAATATQKASAAATSASGAAASKTAAAASEAEAKAAAAEAKAVAVPLKPSNYNSVVQNNPAYPNEAEANESVALGALNRANGHYSITQGWGNNITPGAPKGTAFGKDNIVTGNTAAAIGRDNNANGYGAVAIGNNTVADGKASAALGGYNTAAKEDYQVAIGTNNAPNEEASVIIGAGNKIARQNVATFRKDGSMTLGGKFVDATMINTHKAIGYWDEPRNNNEVQLNRDANKIKGHTASGSWLVTSTTSAGGVRAQMLIRKAPQKADGTDFGIVQIVKGNGYRFSFQVMGGSGDNQSIRFWLTADSSTSCYTETAQKNAAVIYESNDIAVSKSWTTIHADIPNAAYGGNLRLGICDADYTSSNAATFYIKDIKVWDNPDDGVAVYHYKSYGTNSKDPNGAIDKYLYKIGENQAIDPRDWLSDGIFSTSFNTGNPETPTSFARDYYGEPTAENGDGNNYFVVGTLHPVPLVCVDWVVSGKHDVLERGIYVDPTVFEVGYRKWVDNDFPIMPGNVAASTFANALRGKKRGGTVRIDDAAPVQHELTLQVKSKNLIPQPYANGTKTINGVTFTVNEDGTITANGTASSEVNTYYEINRTTALMPGTTYTLTGCPAGGSGSTYCLYVEVADATTGWYTGSIFDLGEGATFTIKKATTIRILMTIRKGVACDNVVFSPQIEEGATATAYTKGVTPAAVTVRRNGKNLIPYLYANGTKTINGITFTVNEDRSITVNGTATATATFPISEDDALSDLIGQTVTLSGCPAGGSESTYRLRYQQTGILSDVGNGATFTVKVKNYLAIQVFAGTVCNNVVFKPQIEAGDTATAYEPYSPPTEYTPAADGTVAGVLTLDPTITLTTDSAGAVLEAEYSRDVNKAFAALQAAVEALQS